MLGLWQEVDSLMLSSEFSVELGALIRSLQDRIFREVDLREGDPQGALPLDMDRARSDLDRAIIRLIALRLSL